MYVGRELAFLSLRYTPLRHLLDLLEKIENIEKKVTCALKGLLKISKIIE